MSKISDLVFRYLHRKLLSSKATPTQYTASSGSARTAVCAALTEMANYWNGAIVRWDAGPNVGFYSSVLSFDATTDTLAFDEDLPVAVASGDKFTLLLGGLYASDQQIPGMKASTPVNVTGFITSYCGMLNSEGTGQLNFYFNGGVGQTLSWTPPGEIEGVHVNISALTNGQNVVLFGGGTTSTQKSKFVQLTRTVAAFPTSDQQDDINLTLPTGSFLAGFVGADTESGVTIYRPVCLENTGTGKLYALKAYCPSPWPTAGNTTIATGGAIGISDANLNAASLLNWGAHGFVFNSTKNDLRYFFNRSGNTIAIMNPAGGIRGFTAVTWEFGDAIEPFPWFDVGLDAPGAGNAFEEPSDENTAPTGVAFSCPRTALAGLLVGDLAAGALYTIWERFFIPAGFRPLESGLADLRVYAEATE